MTNRSYKLNCICLMFIISLLGIGHGCSTKTKDTTQYCTVDDFKKMTKIDIHCHMDAERPAFMEIAKEDNFRILTINTGGA